MGPKRTLEVSRHACNRCRAAKVRCLLDTVAEFEKCRRCYENDKACVFNDIAPRSRRERADTRLRLLEQEVKLLKDKLDGALCTSLTPRAEVMPNPQKTLLPSNHSDPQASTRLNHDDAEEYAIAAYGMLDEAEVFHTTLTRGESRKLISTFVDTGLPQYPVLAFDAGLSFDKLEQANPMLCFAMVTAATRASDPILFRRLHLHLSRILAEKIVVRGGRSLELLQSLLVAEVWYDPPDNLGQLNFELWLRIAANLAQQLGLLWDEAILKAISRDEATVAQMERWRTALSTYLSLSSASISLRRVNTMNIPSPMRTVVAKYAANAARPNDRRLAAWITLHLMIEEIEGFRAQATEQELGVHVVGIHVADLNSRLMLYERETEMDNALRVYYLYICSKLHELQVLLYSRGFPSQGRVTADSTSHDRTFYEQAIIDLVRTSQLVIDTVIRMPVQEYLHSPTVTTVRSLYVLRNLQLLGSMTPDPQAAEKSVSIHNLAEFDKYRSQLDQYFTKVNNRIGHRMPLMALTAIQSLCKPKLQETGRSSASQRTQVNMSENDLEAVTTTTLDIAHASTPNVASGETGKAVAPDYRDPQSFGSFHITSSQGHECSSSLATDVPLDASFWDLFMTQSNLWDDSFFLVG